jgi:hypothetical protein
MYLFDILQWSSPFEIGQWAKLFVPAVEKNVQ